MEKLKVIIVLVLLAFIINCGQGKTEKSENDSKKETKQEVKTLNKKEKDKKKDEDDTVPVQVITPQKGDISSFLLFSSNIDTEKPAGLLRSSGRAGR